MNFFPKLLPLIRRLSPAAPVFVWVIPLLFITLLVGRNWEFFQLECDKTGDHALIALGVEKAKLFQALVGPYSRHHFRHPGPFFFYLYAFSDWIFFFLPSHYGRYALGQVVLNSVFLISALHAMYRGTGSAFSACVLFISVLCIFPADRGSFFSGIWGPLTLPCPMLAFLILSAAISAGNLRFWAVWALSAAALMSNHLGTFVIVVPIFFITVMECCRRGRDQLDRWAKAGILAGIFILAAASALPLSEALSRPDFGNAGRIMDFILHQRHEKRFVTSLRYISSFFVSPEVAIALIAVCLAVPLNTDPFLRILKYTGLTALVLSVIGALNLKGSLYPYVMWPVYSIVVVLTVVAVSGAAMTLKGWVVRYGLKEPSFAPGAAFVFACAIGVWIVSGTGQYEFPYRCVSYGRFERMVSELELEKGALYIVENAGGASQWQRVAGLVLEINRRGSEACVPERLGFMFGEDFVCKNALKRRGENAVRARIPVSG